MENLGRSQERKKGHGDKKEEKGKLRFGILISPCLPEVLGLRFFGRGRTEEQKKFIQRSTALQQVGKKMDLGMPWDAHEDL